jgi:hypothetical protein
MSRKPPALVENDKTHFNALVALSPGQQWGVKYLYDRLNIIDSKTSALLRFNGIALGFLTLLALRILEAHATLNLRPYAGSYLALCCVIFILLSYAEYQAFCIFYLKFDRITAHRSFDDYLEAFFRITCSRERRYHRALWASAVGGALFVFLVLALILQSNLVWVAGTPFGYLKGMLGL